MTATTADGELEIPFKAPQDFWAQVLRFLALVLPCLLASLIAGAVRPGSVAVLCYVLPLLVLLQDLRPRLREKRVLVHLAFVGGALLGVVLEPGWLNLTMGWLTLLALAIEARSVGTHAALSALRAIGRAIVVSPFGIAVETVSSIRHVPVKPRHLKRLPLESLALPLLAVFVFTQLLAYANPLFERLLLDIDFGNPFAWADRLFAQLLTFESFVFIVALLMFWPVLRGKNVAKTFATEADDVAPFWHATFFKPLAVIITLVLLNLMFAIENSLDLQHLWLDPLQPGSYHHAAYVHRGAYTLIVTATLAGVLMLTALRKGTATEASPLVRLLVYAFAAQNLMLVASSVQRTLLYIDAYGWTEWRFSGLVWMCLVFFGLVTIFWRVAQNRDSRWLINTNIIATTVVLLAVGVWNMQGFVAEKNVERALARTVPSLDMVYVQELHINALPAIESYVKALLMRQRPNTKPDLGQTLLVDSHRAENVANTFRLERDAQQSDWRSWNVRHAM